MLLTTLYKKSSSFKVSELPITTSNFLALVKATLNLL